MGSFALVFFRAIRVFRGSLSLVAAQQKTPAREVLALRAGVLVKTPAITYFRV
jgi:hypothetical protein